jgi:adenylyl-sulfate kinase
MAKCYFFTGLSGSGKTTLARELNNRIHAVWLDGDDIRNTPIVENPQDFSFEARAKHIRRLGYIAKMFIDQNINVIISCIAPDRSVRNEVRGYFKADEFVEIYVKTPLEICEQRDCKGLYKRARNGEIQDFTGIGSRYEEPLNPEFVVDYEKLEKGSTIGRLPLVIASQFINVIPRPICFLIGRFQPLTLGHIELINKALETYHVIIGVKFTTINMNNPFTPNQIKKLIRSVYPDIEIQVIPDFDFIGHGRNTGYSMKMIDVDNYIKNISATHVRNLIRENNRYWKLYVPEQAIPIMEEVIKCKK